MTVVFWSVALALTAAAVLMLWWPLRGRGALARATPTPEGLNLAVYRDQLAELEADLQRGVLDAAQYEAARIDLERGVLATSESAAPAASEARTPASRLAVALVLLVPMAAVPLYIGLGAGSESLQPERFAAADDHPTDLEQMVESLRVRLAENPGEVGGWVMMGRSLSVMGRYEEAAGAYAQALSLGADRDVDTLADYADVLAVLQGRWLGGRPLSLIERALALDPRHEKSLWLAGTAAYQLSDYRTARDYWGRLAMLLPPGSESARTVQENLREVSRLLGEAPPPVPQAARIEGRVAVAPALGGDIGPGDTVFIIARAVGGTQAPVAVLGRPAAELPFDFVLDDSTAMMPELGLSSVDLVEVTARVSRTGQTKPMPGDLHSARALRVSPASGERIQLLLDERL
jgi:cytochrome c-type biogenesis protein CcmH